MIHLIERFGKDIEVISNTGEKIIVDGYFQDTRRDTTRIVRASVQPMTARELQMLPEGSDTKEALKLYTIERLNPRSGNPTKKGDFFLNNGDRYEVISCEDHTSHESMNIFYFKIIGMKVAYDS